MVAYREDNFICFLFCLQKGLSNMFLVMFTEKFLESVFGCFNRDVQGTCYRSSVCKSLTSASPVSLLLDTFLLNQTSKGGSQPRFALDCLSFKGCISTWVWFAVCSSRGRSQIRFVLKLTHEHDKEVYLNPGLFWSAPPTSRDGSHPKFGLEGLSFKRSISTQFGLDNLSGRKWISTQFCCGVSLLQKVDLNVGLCWVMSPVRSGSQPRLI